MSHEDHVTGIVLFAHGSSVEEANAGVRELAKEVQVLGPYKYVRAAFLELGDPDLAKAVSQAVEAGLQRVVVIPFFLTLGIHLRRDLPSLIAPLKKKYPDLVLEASQSLEGHPLMASIILERAQEFLGAAKTTR